jgi:hypothetical protein
VFPAADLIDWTREPEQSLSQLYRVRAQRLRNEYDYLILMFSGGSDSTQVMMSFLNSGIPLDEVHTYYPMRWVERVTGDVPRDHPLGLLYEYHHAVVPALRTLSLVSPRTKIRVIDTSDSYNRSMADWSEAPNQHRPNGGVHGLYQGIYRACVERGLRRATDPIGTKKIGVIYGNEKPPVQLDGADLSVQFLDTQRGGISHAWMPDRLFDPIMFYWGDLRITCKQAHIIKRALEHDRSIISDLDVHRRLIYPDWTFRYQERENVHAALLLTCFDGADWVRSAAAERTQHYNSRYQLLGNVNVLTDVPATGRRGVRVQFARGSKRYHVGSLKEE